MSTASVARRFRQAFPPPVRRGRNGTLWYEPPAGVRIAQKPGRGAFRAHILVGETGSTAVCGEAGFTKAVRDVTETGMLCDTCLRRWAKETR